MPNEEKFTCPQGHKIQEDEIHSCSGASFYAPGLLAVMKRLIGLLDPTKPTIVEAQPVKSQPENTLDRKPRGREKR